MFLESFADSTSTTHHDSTTTPFSEASEMTDTTGNDSLFFVISY